MQAFQDAQKNLAQLLTAWQQLQQKELPQLNQELQRAGLTPLSPDKGATGDLGASPDGEDN